MKYKYSTTIPFYEVVSTSNIAETKEFNDFQKRILLMLVHHDELNISHLKFSDALEQVFNIRKTLNPIIQEMMKEIIEDGNIDLKFDFEAIMSKRVTTIASKISSNVVNNIKNEKFIGLSQKTYSKSIKYYYSTITEIENVKNISDKDVSFSKETPEIKFKKSKALDDIHESLNIGNNEIIKDTEILEHELVDVEMPISFLLKDNKFYPEDELTEKIINFRTRTNTFENIKNKIESSFDKTVGNSTKTGSSRITNLDNYQESNLILSSKNCEFYKVGNNIVKVFTVLEKVSLMDEVLQLNIPYEDDINQDEILVKSNIKHINQELILKTKFKTDYLTFIKDNLTTSNVSNYKDILITNWDYNDFSLDNKLLVMIFTGNQTYDVISKLGLNSFKDNIDKVNDLIKKAKLDKDKVYNLFKYDVNPDDIIIKDWNEHKKVVAAIKFIKKTPIDDELTRSELETIKDQFIPLKPLVAISNTIEKYDVSLKKLIQKSFTVPKDKLLLYVLDMRNAIETLVDSQSELSNKTNTFAKRVDATKLEKKKEIKTHYKFLSDIIHKNEVQKSQEERILKLKEKYLK